MARTPANFPGISSAASHSDSNNTGGSETTQSHIPERLQPSLIVHMSRLKRLWSSRWIHPQRKAYIHAFVDTSNCWILTLTLAYINGLDGVLCSGTKENVDFNKIHTAVSDLYYLQD